MPSIFDSAIYPILESQLIILIARSSHKPSASEIPFGSPNSEYPDTLALTAKEQAGELSQDNRGTRSLDLKN